MEDRLHKFAHLVEAHSFTKAAAGLHISQPALTTAIKKLERELRAELLVRGGHTFRLTSAGELAYATAKELGIQTSNLKLRLQEAADEKVALNLGMIDSIADLLFVHGDQLQELEEGARLSLTVNNSTQLIQLVANDELEVALIAAPAQPITSLEVTPVAEEPLALVASAAVSGQVIDDLQHGRIEHFLGYNQNSQTFQLVERHFKERGVTMQTTFYSTSPEIMLQLVLAGRGAAVLPYLLVKNYLAAGSLTAIATRGGGSGYINRQIVSINRAGRVIPKSAQRLLDNCQSGLGLLRKEVQAL